MYKDRENTIQNYIDGYNTFDIKKMIRDLDDNIVFKNIQNGEINITLKGIDDFKKQAEEAKIYFENRRQEIISLKHTERQTEIEIAYTAVLAKDFPNGLKKGQEIKLKGKSIFEFQKHKIIVLTDIS